MAGSESSGGVFKWVCLLLALVFGIAMLSMVYGLYTRVHYSTELVNERLERILENTDKTTATLAAFAEDLRRLRDLAGLKDKQREDGLIAYTDRVLDFIENTEAEIGVAKVVSFSNGLKNLEPAHIWVRSNRKRAVWLVASQSSKRAVVEELTSTEITGSSYYIQFPDAEPEPLLDWLIRNHPETAEVFAEAEVD